MAFSLCTLANVSELRYIDAVRTLVRTTFLIILNEVNSESQPNLEILMQFEQSENYVPYSFSKR